MSERRTVNVVCAKAPRRVGCVPAVHASITVRSKGRAEWSDPGAFYCSFCGARVRVVA